MSFSISAPFLPITMPGPRGVDVDLRLVGGALDLDLRDARVVEALLQEVADLDVLVQQLGVLAPGEPARVPVLDDAEPEALRMYLLSHASALRALAALVDDDGDVAACA